MVCLNPIHAITAFGLLGHIPPQPYYLHYSSAPTKGRSLEAARFSWPWCTGVEIILVGLVDRLGRLLGPLLAPPNRLHRG